jgi:hypothetical protein
MFLASFLVVSGLKHGEGKVFRKEDSTSEIISSRYNEGPGGKLGHGQLNEIGIEIAKTSRATASSRTENEEVRRIILKKGARSMRREKGSEDEGREDEGRGE